MGEFFKGWSRKAGCLALMLATALTILWVRTLVVADCFQLGTVGFGSFRGGIYWILDDAPSLWSWETMTEDEARTYLGDMTLSEVLAEELSSPSEADIIYGYALYWWLVAPLTALSACLILRPRPCRSHVGH